MSVAVLCIGSNLDEAEARGHILRATTLIGACCNVETSSDIYVVDLPYYNKVLKVDTDVDFAGLVAYTKALEKALGRRADMKKAGIVPIDIDVVVFDGEVKRPRDFSQPYFTRGYSELELISQGGQASSLL